MKFNFNQYYLFLIGRRRGEQKDTNTTRNKHCLQQMLLSQFRKFYMFNITSSKRFKTSSSTMAGPLCDTNTPIDATYNNNFVHSHFYTRRTYVVCGDYLCTFSMQTVINLGLI